MKQKGKNMDAICDGASGIRSYDVVVKASDHQYDL